MYCFSQNEEVKYRANLDETDEDTKSGTGNIPMSPKRSRANSLSSTTPEPEKKKITISDVEL